MYAYCNRWRSVILYLILEDVINFFNELPDNCFKIFLRDETDSDIDVGDITINKPALVKIENKITVLICPGNNIFKYLKIWKYITPDKLMINLLKKRHLDPVFNKKIYKEDPFLEEIPDIFASGNFQKSIMSNYKGTTIISTGSFLSEPIFWLIKFKTRETIKVDFT